MGRQSSDQASLFYEFRLDARVPQDHLLRHINVFMTPVLGGVHEHLKSYYSEIGRPLDRPRVDDPDADCRVLLRPALRAQADPGSRTASGIPLVLQARSR